MSTDDRIAAAIAKQRRTLGQLRVGDKIIRGQDMQYGWVIKDIDTDGDWTVIRFTNRKVVYLDDPDTVIHVVTD